MATLAPDKFVCVEEDQNIKPNNQLCDQVSSTHKVFSLSTD